MAAHAQESVLDFEAPLRKAARACPQRCLRARSRYSIRSSCACRRVAPCSPAAPLPVPRSSPCRPAGLPWSVPPWTWSRERGTGAPSRPGSGMLEVSGSFRSPAGSLPARLSIAALATQAVRKPCVNGQCRKCRRGRCNGRLTGGNEEIAASAVPKLRHHDCVFSGDSHEAAAPPRQSRQADHATPHFSAAPNGTARPDQGGSPPEEGGTLPDAPPTKASSRSPRSRSQGCRLWTQAASTGFGRNRFTTSERGLTMGMTNLAAPDRHQTCTHLKLKVSLRARLRVPCANREIMSVPQRDLRSQRDRLQPRGTAVKGGPEGRVSRKRRVDNSSAITATRGLPSNSTPRGGCGNPAIREGNSPGRNVPAKSN